MSLRTIWFLMGAITLLFTTLSAEAALIAEQAVSSSPSTPKDVDSDLGDFAQVFVSGDTPLTLSAVDYLATVSNQGNPGVVFAGVLVDSLPLCSSLQDFDNKGLSGCGRATLGEWYPQQPDCCYGVPTVYHAEGLPVVIPAHTVFLLRFNVSGADKSVSLWGSPNDSFPNSRLYRAINISTSTDSNIQDAFFRLYGEGSLASAPAKTPVIIVPGIMGSKLNRVSDGEEVWPNVGKMMNPLTPDDDYLDDLILDSQGDDIISIHVDRILDSALGQIIYGGLSEAFVSSGYVSGTTLFEFAYDWRRDLQDEVGRFDALVQDVLAVSPDRRVNVVAHSMGGLLIKQYLIGTTSTDFLDRVVIVGSPQIGAPLAFKVINSGDDMGMSLFGVGLNEAKIKEISQNMPGVYQLLPSRQYIAANGGYVEDFRSIGPKTALTYDQTSAYMLENPSDSRNPALLTLADQFHGALDAQPINAPRIFNIVGCQNPTIGKFRIYDNGKYDIDMVDGDGTVPFSSAMNLANGYEQNYFVRFDMTGADHLGLVQKSGVLALIRGIIEDDQPLVTPGIFTSSSECTSPTFPDLSDTTISVATFSPVALHAYDAQNRHVGPLPSGDIELAIPGARYERLGENTFIFLPTGADYHFAIDGLAQGAFDLKIRGYRGSSQTGATIFLDVPLAGDQTNAAFDVSTIGPTTVSDLRVDAGGDAVFEDLRAPSAAVSSTLASDGVPPIITISSPSSTTYTRPTVLPIAVDVSDIGSGVAFSRVYWDGVLTTSTTRDLFFESLGQHAISVHAVDLLGNPSHATATLQVIATFPSTITDINRSYNLGWISSKKIRDALIVQVKLIAATRDPATQKNLLRLFSKELDFWRAKDALTWQAHAILKEDIQWLVSN